MRDLTDDLPREKLSRRGLGALTDQELLALILGHGGAGRTVFDIAGALLADVGGTHGLARASLSRLARAAGIGAAQASRILAAVELGRRTVTTPASPRLALDSPKALGEFLLPRFGAHAMERLGVVLLDGRHRLIQVHVVSEGATDRVIGVPRDVFREAVIAGAAGLVLFHNHPSGDPTPSAADIRLTQRLAEAGALVGIVVVDHIILGDGVYCSLRAARHFVNPADSP